MFAVGFAMDYIVHGILQARILEWVAISFFKGSSQPRDWTQVSHIEGRFFTAEPPGKPKNTGVGSLSLLRGSSQPRNWTRVAGGFFTSWATREALLSYMSFSMLRLFCAHVWKRFFFFFFINGSWILLKTFSASVEIIMWFFIFQFVSMVYYFDRFAYIDEFLHPWDKFNLMMVYNLFSMLLDSVW